MLKRAPRPWGIWCGGAIGVLWFVCVTSPGLLDPRRIEPFSRGDLGQNLAGWLFYQRAPWRWPLGAFDNYVTPVGTSVAFTDSIPWVAVIAKALLGRDHAATQWVGPWLALCSFLQGWFAARLARFVSPHALVHVAAAVLFVASPVFGHRFGHATLCAHWLILALLEQNVVAAISPSQRRAVLIRLLAFEALAVGFHPYLLAMVLVLAISGAAQLARQAERRARVEIALFAVVTPVVVLITAWAFGYFTGVASPAQGFGDFSTDLAAFINPITRDRSALLGPLPVGPGQYEGFAYLGAGGLALAALALVLLWRTGRVSGEEGKLLRAPLVGACVALALYSLATPVTFLGHALFGLDAIYALVKPITASFRSSGRFIWPVYYLVLASSMFVVLRKLAPARGMLALSVAGALQVVDTRHANVTAVFAKPASAGFADPTWDALPRDYAHLAMVPPEVRSNTFRCPDAYDEPAFEEIVFTAARLGVSFNGGTVARLDGKKEWAECARLRGVIENGRLDEDTVYIVAPSWFPALPRAAVTCGRLSGLEVCVSSVRHTPFELALRERSGRSWNASEIAPFATGWHDAENAKSEHWRWAKRRATLRLPRPANQRRARFAATGWVAADATDPTTSTPTLTWTIDGIERVSFLAPRGRFTRELVVELNPSRVEQEWVEVVLESSTAPKIAGDTRELAFSLLTFEWPDRSEAEGETRPDRSEAEGETRPDRSEAEGETRPDDNVPR